MGNKYDKFLDAIFGNKIKGRAQKLLIGIVILLMTLALVVGMIILALSINYNKKDGIYIKPPEVKVQIDLKNK